MRSKYSRQGSLDHVELIFDDGKALIFHLMLENDREIMAFIEKMSAGVKVIEQ